MFSMMAVANSEVLEFRRPLHETAEILRNALISNRKLSKYPTEGWPRFELHSETHLVIDFKPGKRRK
jgi:hypothetical protein